MNRSGISYFSKGNVQLEGNARLGSVHTKCRLCILAVKCRRNLWDSFREKILRVLFSTRDDPFSFITYILETQFYCTIYWNSE